MYKKTIFLMFPYIHPYFVRKTGGYPDDDFRKRKKKKKKGGRGRHSGGEVRGANDVRDESLTGVSRFSVA